MSGRVVPFRTIPAEKPCDTRLEDLSWDELCDIFFDRATDEHFECVEGIMEVFLRYDGQGGPLARPRRAPTEHPIHAKIRELERIRPRAVAVMEPVVDRLIRDTITGLV